MKTVLVTGARGFLGQHLCFALRQLPEVELLEVDAEDAADEVRYAITAADIVFHLAGVNRSQVDLEFFKVNVGFTQTICDVLASAGRASKIVFASSAQAGSPTPYGQSKLIAEGVIERYVGRSRGGASVYRLNGVFGSWCRPNYNSVIATFCHSIARGLPIEISDASRVITVCFAGDVVEAFLAELNEATNAFVYRDAPLSHQISLGDLADLLKGFTGEVGSGLLPDLSSRFLRQLYGTYLSYREPPDLVYPLDAHTDARGSLAEFVKQPCGGQVFVSRTRPGVVRGNHYHTTKVERFLVVEGKAVIRLRRINQEIIQSFVVEGTELRMVVIPPGFTHSIENVGSSELVTLFWSSEMFDPKRPDTAPMQVQEGRPR